MSTHKNISTNNAVLMFDGFMIPKTLISDEIVEDLNSYCENKWNIKIKQKPMDVLDLSNLTTVVDPYLQEKEIFEETHWRIESPLFYM